MFPSRQFVVDAGAGHVAGGVWSVGAGGRLVLEEFALEVRSSDPSLDPAWMEKTAEALAAVAKGRKLRGPAALAVPGHLTLTKFVQTRAVAAPKRRQVIQFEAAQAIPYPLEAVAWDHLVVADGAQDIEIMLTAVKRDVMENLCAAAEQAGFPVKRAAASCLTLYRAFGINYPGSNDPVLVVDIGARSTNLLLISPGGRFFARTFPLAGNAVTVAVAEELKIGFAQAETLKRQATGVSSASADNSPGRDAVLRATAGFVGRLQLEITRSIGNFTLRTGAAKPVAIYLTGGGSLLSGLAPALAEKFALQVERYDPLRNVELSERARAAGAAEATHLLANLIGLAATAPAGSGEESGLLPPAVRAVRAFRRRQPCLLGAATLLAVALLAPAWHYHWMAETDEARAREVSAQTKAMRITADGNASVLGRIAAVRKEVAGLQRLAGAKSNWMRFLGDLQSGLVEVDDAWLERLAILPAPAATPSAGAAAGALALPPVLRLQLSGRLLVARGPGGDTGPETDERVKALLAGFARSPFIAGIEHERFDTTKPGVLGFDLTLAVNPAHPL